MTPGALSPSFDQPHSDSSAAPAPAASPGRRRRAPTGLRRPPARRSAAVTGPGLKLRYDINSLDNRSPRFIEGVCHFVDTVLRPYHRAEIRGVERIPDGAALYVGNHSGGAMTIDSFLFGAAVYRHHGFGALPYVLTHDFPLRAPLLHQVFCAVGSVRATRHNANRLFDGGHKVLVYPGGSEEALRPFRDRNRIRFGGHRGYVRLALRHGVPIVPVVGQGSHATFVVIDDARWFARLMHLDKLLRIKAWGVTLSLPWGLTLFPPPLYLPLPTKIRMEVMPPIRFDRTGAAAAEDEPYVDACCRQVESAMQATLDRLASE